MDEILLSNAMVNAGAKSDFTAEGQISLNWQHILGGNIPVYRCHIGNYTAFVSWTQHVSREESRRWAVEIYRTDGHMEFSEPYLIGDIKGEQWQKAIDLASVVVFEWLVESFATTY